MLTYVMGPYGAETEEGRLANVYEAMRIGHALLARGHSPIIPHLTHYFDAYMRRFHDVTVSWDRWLEIDEDILRHCEAAYFIGPSPGADRERTLCERLGIRVYTHIDQVPERKRRGRILHDSGPSCPGAPSYLEGASGKRPYHCTSTILGG
jgi:hypothetical protein